MMNNRLRKRQIDREKKKSKSGGGEKRGPGRPEAPRGGYRCANFLLDLYQRH